MRHWEIVIHITDSVYFIVSHQFGIWRIWRVTQHEWSWTPEKGYFFAGIWMRANWALQFIWNLKHTNLRVQWVLSEELLSVAKWNTFINCIQINFRFFFFSAILLVTHRSDSFIVCEMWKLVHNSNNSELKGYEHRIIIMDSLNAFWSVIVSQLLTHSSEATNEKQNTPQNGIGNAILNRMRYCENTYYVHSRA